ncbi:ImmA/IrrE family metallo-endopeptidase [Sphingomonas sp. So64.6b]|uniref:ImmA/IrrE family metallo-endopeptidase n=1 Tax=Sphingomonas sp. So64.6b TaxID=2997354 RepID=UPI0016032194|nr:ImmA/IrrE family metallo-endopeptidase [Sphingomonas sp. So64.6b]QNA84940.1 ImmA/IrrE family metallo-endopeptidase [Sphingomonas sp. So64.6b]
MPQPATLPNDIETYLENVAHALNAAHSGTPILLKDICASLNITVLRRQSVPKGKAYLSWDRTSLERPQIHLPLTRHKTWDRFCAAHEIGHFFLIDKFDYIPTSRESYWKTEELCDYFARSLLIPKELIKNDLDLNTHEQIISTCDHISETAYVPWLQTAKRISENVPRVALFTFRWEDSVLKTTGSSLKGHKGRFRELSQETEAYRRIKWVFESTAPANIFSIDLNEFNGSKFGDFLKKIGAGSISFRVSARNGTARAVANI